MLGNPLSVSGDTNSDPPRPERTPTFLRPSGQSALPPFAVTITVVLAGSLLRLGTRGCHARAGQSRFPFLSQAVALSSDHQSVTMVQQAVQDL